MRLSFFFLLACTFFYTSSDHAISGKNNSFQIREKILGSGPVFSAGPLQDGTAPRVKIVIPDGKETLGWNAQVRYAIEVSDAKDGESKYGEIPANEVLLEIQYLPSNKEAEVKAQINKSPTNEGPKGLTLIQSSTCFGCHADKTRVAGPAFSEIAQRYKQSPEVISTLGSHIIKGSSGVWGTLEMPPHPDFSQEQATQIASYILKQGGDKYHWIYPGLEGAFRTMEKPKDNAEGLYVLTASYTSRSGKRGEHSIVFKIK